MFFLIYNNQVVGTSDSADPNLPEGYQIVDGPDAPMDDVFWDGISVGLRPPRPSAQHFWSNEELDWISPIPPSFAEASRPDWDRFLDGIGPEILGKIAASPLAALLIARVSRLADNPALWQGQEDRFYVLWNAAPPDLTTSDRSTLESLAVAHQVPIRINSSNLLTLA